MADTESEKNTFPIFSQIFSKFIFWTTRKNYYWKPIRRAATPESSAYIRIQSVAILAPDRSKSRFESGVETPDSNPDFGLGVAVLLIS